MAAVAATPSRVAPATTTTTVSEPPAAFLCPITRMLMEHPHVTVLGTTYEHAAIAEWLAKHDTDPQTNQSLAAKQLIPNLNLRSQIQEWVAAHPQQAAEWRNHAAVKPPVPPAAAAAAGGATDLRQVVRYVRTTAKPNKAKRAAQVPSPIHFEGRTFEFRRGQANAAGAAAEAGAGAAGRLQVRCRDGPEGPSAWITMPPRTTSLFPTRRGVAFFHPAEMHDVLVLPDEAGSVPGAPAACKFGATCNRDECKFAHPFVCPHGVQCDGQATTCKFIHPKPDSVVPLGEAFPLNTACKFGVACTNKTCHFAHPNGRATVDRVPKQLFVTHTLDLDPLDDPKPLDFRQASQRATGNAAGGGGGGGSGHTKFVFQGQCAFFFTPYPGTWAKEHFQTCTFLRFSPSKQRHVKVADWSLAGHYCNAAVGVDRFVLVSWWPYQDEAMRAIWEAVKQMRHLGKVLAANERELADQQAVITRQEDDIAKSNKVVQRQQKQLQHKKKALKHATHKLQCEEQKGREREQRQREEQKRRQREEQKRREREQRQREYEQRQAQREQRQHEYEERQAKREQRQREWEERQAQREQRQREWEERQAQREQRQREYEQRQRDRQQREEAFRRERQRRERERLERWRLQDPIHVFALDADASGESAADWHLVVDYHKGAHALELDPATGDDGCQRLRLTENQQVFEVDLVPVDDASALGHLPMVPDEFCPGF